MQTKLTHFSTLFKKNIWKGFYGTYNQLVIYIHKRHCKNTRRGDCHQQELGWWKVKIKSVLTGLWYSYTNKTISCYFTSQFQVCNTIIGSWLGTILLFDFGIEVFIFSYFLCNIYKAVNPLLVHFSWCGSIIESCWFYKIIMIIKVIIITIIINGNMT